MATKKARAAGADERRRRIGYEARRALIIEAAMEVFAEEGYQGASLEAIASRAGVTKPVLYDHFTSKQVLHLTLLERERDEAVAHILERLQSGGRPDQRVATALDAFFEWVQLHPYAWRMLFRESTGEPEIVKAHERIQTQASAAIVEALLTDGDVERSELERAMSSQLVGAAVNGLTRWWYENRTVDRAELVQLVMDILWMGLERFRGGRRYSGRGTGRRRG